VGDPPPPFFRGAAVAGGNIFLGGGGGVGGGGSGVGMTVNTGFESGSGSERGGSSIGGVVGGGGGGGVQPEVETIFNLQSYSQNAPPGESGGEGGGITDLKASSLYQAMRSWTLSEHICVRRSPIHGWGLFVKENCPRDTVLIEYAGQVVRQPIADRREVAYEESARVTGRFNHMAGVGTEGGGGDSDKPHHPTLTQTAVTEVAAAGGEAGSSSSDFDLRTAFGVPLGGRRSDGSGSCYLFRLDEERIVDATMEGCAARFINHCCEPNCYSRVITVDGEKRIGICAKTELEKGSELTYNCSCREWW